MPYRTNPFYQYSNPYLGQAFNGLAAVMFPNQGADAVRQAAAQENMAQMRQADAAAALSNEKTRGARNVNDAMTSDPLSIAEILLAGGVPQDDPLQTNPNYKAPAPIDFSSLDAIKAPADDGSSSLFLPQRTARDKMAAAIREAVIRKIPLDQLLKAAGINEYQRRAMGENPDSALSVAPFVGVTPNTQTALTTGRQDQISARDAAEDQAKQDTINQTSISRTELQQTGATERNAATNKTNITREGMRQAGADRRNDADNQTSLTREDKRQSGASQRNQDRIDSKASTTQSKPGKVTAVPAQAIKRMQKKIEDALKSQGITSDQQSMDGLMAAAGTAWQSSKNPDAAADDVVQRLINGETINGVSMKKKDSWLGEKKSTSRSTPPPGSASTPMPAAPAPAPAAASKPAAAPPQAAIDHLRKNPQLKDAFDAKYGAGSAAKYMK